MNILLIGGTRFVGRHLVEAALDRGHQITLFHRGKTNPGLFPQAEEIFGDRETDLDKLAGRRWDAAIDTSGYLPRAVRLSAQMLKDNVSQYVYISTISVYADFDVAGIDEDYKLDTMEDESVEEVTDTSYGPLKVLCEKVVQEIYPDNGLILRPGVVVGPYDYTDRFTYWVVRAARGGEVLAPVGPQAPVQFIYARDLANFALDCIEEKTTGVFNVVGPEDPGSLGVLLETSKRVSGGDAKFVWVSEEFIEEQDIGPWSELPLWVPESEGQGFSRVSNARAQAAGLEFTPLEDIVRETLEWAHSRPDNYELKAGLKPEREAELLDKKEV